MMHDNNQPMPPKLVTILDDAVARQIALYYELADELKDPGCPGPRRGALVADGHPTHWVICARFWGHAEAKENGYVAIFIPRAAAKTAQDALNQFLQIYP